MPRFRYEALDGSGRRLTGTMDGGNRGDVIAELNRAGFLPIEARESRAGAGRTLREMLTPEPKSEDVTALTLDIVMLLQGGVMLSEALVLLSQMDSRGWRVRVLRELHRAIASGKTFSAALAEHPRLFSPVYVKMVEVAEATGRLDKALASLAEERQRVERLRKKLVGAVSYPAFLVIAALSAMVFIFTYVIPQFETALEGFRDKVDPTALMVFNASRFLRTHGQDITIGLGAAALSLIALGRLGASRGLWLQLVAKLPVARTGRRLSEALESRSFLPRHVVRMLRVGEDSGRLPDSASRVAVFYEARLDTALTRAIAVIGPATMILVSILIAWLIISVMTALMSVNDLLK